jgi:hypothetical protein
MPPRTEVPPGVVERLRAAGCVFAEKEARLLVEAAGTPGELERLLARRISGLPLEQVLGWVDFCGIRLTMRPGGAPGGPVGRSGLGGAGHVLRIRRRWRGTGGG